MAYLWSQSASCMQVVLFLNLQLFPRLRRYWRDSWRHSNSDLWMLQWTEHLCLLQSFKGLLLGNLCIPLLLQLEGQVVCISFCTWALPLLQKQLCTVLPRGDAVQSEEAEESVTAAKADLE
eukprot:2814460-Amphidinium_carterae.1